MYFQEHQYLLYPDFQSVPEKELIVSNIFKRVVLRTDLIVDNSNYYEYQMTDTDTLENMADRFYGSPYYYWVILFLNKHFDPLWDMPMPEPVFQSYIISKYGSLRNASAEFDSYETDYTISGTTVTVVCGSAHGLLTGDKVYLDFSIGNTINGIYDITYLSNLSFSVTVTETDRDGEAGLVEVCPPYMNYYVRNSTSDAEFFRADKMTYDITTDADLKALRSAMGDENIINENKKIILILREELLSDFVNRFKGELAK